MLHLRPGSKEQYFPPFLYAQLWTVPQPTMRMVYQVPTRWKLWTVEAAGHRSRLRNVGSTLVTIIRRWYSCIISGAKLERGDAPKRHRWTQLAIKSTAMFLLCCFYLADLSDFCYRALTVRLLPFVCCWCVEIERQVIEFVCLLVWYLTALSAQIGYIVLQRYSCVRKTLFFCRSRSCKNVLLRSSHCVNCHGNVGRSWRCGCVS